ncbi:MAG: asparagine synthase-related protein, partial [Candidatus Hydrogenedentota bacterium]
ERTGLPADSPVGRHLFRYGKAFFQRGAGKCLPPLRRKQKVAMDFNAWMERDAALQEFIRSILFDARTDSRGYFRPDAVRKIVSELFRGRKAYLPLVGRMVTLELWHRYFLEGDQGIEGNVF